MREPASSELRQRVIQAAETVLNRSGSVGRLELFQALRWLQPSHMQAWSKGDEHHPDLERWIQVGPTKLEQSLQIFSDWIQQRGLRPLEKAYTRSTPRGLETLQVTVDGDPAREKLYRTHYAPADLPPVKAQRLAKKLNKAPDLVVFQKVSDDGACSECATPQPKGEFIFMEKGNLLCLACADLDQLVFLPAGDTAVTRRARKHSPLSTVVVRFSRARKRYERQGVLVTAQALARAQEECAADAPARAAGRAEAVVVRAKEDKKFVQAMKQAIVTQFPGCPREEVSDIAEHTALRGSGRVGRSAAGRELDPQAVKLAVVAHIRHAHTNYDQLLMEGADRLDARMLVREQIESVVSCWSGDPP